MAHLFLDAASRTCLFCYGDMIDVNNIESDNGMLSKVIHKVQQVISPQGFQETVDWDKTKSGVTEVDMLVEAKEQLAEICLIKSHDLINKIQLVLNLDEKAYRKAQTLTHDYLMSLASNADLKKEVEVVVYEYLRQLYATYTQLIVEYQHENKALLNTEKLNLLLARYLNAAFMMAKWRYFVDQSAPLGMWKNIHKVIRVAEELNSLNKDLFLYDFQHKETSLAAILKRGFMLDTLQKGSYTQFQIELTDRVLKTWSTNPQISKQYTKQNEYQFFIHLNGDNRPERLRSAKQHSDFRYWKTIRIVDLIEAYLCAADMRKPLDQFNLVMMTKTEDVVGLFKKLRIDWCVKGYKRQRRNEERTTKLNILNVSHGVDEISARVRYLQLRPSATDLVFDGTSLELASDMPNIEVQMSSIPSSQYGRENWTMLEESASGFSVELGKDISFWVKSGALIGYSTLENKNVIALAEIKTVRKRTNGTYRIGLLKVTNNAIALKVNRVQKRTPFDVVADYQVNDGEGGLAFSDVFVGLLVDNDIIERPRLIVPRHQYKRASRYRININGEDHVVLAGEVTNSHRGWICFEVIV